MHKITSGSFNSVLAMEYLDYAQAVRGVGNTTYNNIITNLSAIWTPLVERGYIKKNPFQGIRPKRKEKKKRKPRELKTLVFNQDKSYIGIIFKK